MLPVKNFLQLLLQPSLINPAKTHYQDIVVTNYNTLEKCYNIGCNTALLCLPFLTNNALPYHSSAAM